MASRERKTKRAGAAPHIIYLHPPTHRIHRHIHAHVQYTLVLTLQAREPLIELLRGVVHPGRDGFDHVGLGQLPWGGVGGQGAGGPSHPVAAEFEDAVFVVFWDVCWW